MVLLKNRHESSQHWDIFILWISTIILMLYANLPKIGIARITITKQKIINILPILLILGFGIYFRFYQLGNIPSIMENDEGTVGIKALSVLSGGLTNMFMTYGGYGTLHFFLMALPVKIFGRTIFAIRILTAIYGSLSILFVYLLAKEMFNQKIAFISSMLFGFSHLNIHFSRVSPTASSLDPLLLSGTLLFLYRGYFSRRSIDWIVTGIIMGLGMYFYVGARVIIFVVTGFIVFMSIIQRKDVWENRNNIVKMLITFLVVSAPMLFWAGTNWDGFNARVNTVGIFQNGWLIEQITNQGKTIIEVFWQQFINSLLIFYYSYPTWFYGADIPALGPITGAIFALGILASIPRIREPRFALLNVWFWIMLFLGQMLLVDTSTSAYRTMGILPAVCILGGVALYWLFAEIIIFIPKLSIVIPIVLIILVLVFEGWWNVNYYFNVWAPALKYSDRRGRLESLIGMYLGSQPEGTVAYIAETSNYRGSGSQSFTYLSKDITYFDVTGPIIGVIPDLDLSKKNIFIFPKDRMEEMDFLQAQLPGGKVVRKIYGYDLYFVAYEK